jgi:conjugative transposon TraM protein
MQQQTQHSAKLLRQRKFFLALPLLVLPFMTFLLWSLGLIGTTETKAQSASLKGFNMNLPGAVPAKDSNWNKLKFYEQADKDSARYQSLMKSDPYFSLSPSLNDQPALPDTGFNLSPSNGNGYKLSYDPYPSALQKDKDPNEEKVFKKLAQLNEELNKASIEKGISNESSRLLENNAASVNTEEVDRLESMMQMMNGSAGGDPEMQKIDGMLNKILDIQHPERIKNKLKEQSALHKQQVFPVSAGNKENNISLLQSTVPLKENPVSDSGLITQQPQRVNAFYSFTDEKEGSIDQANALPAVVHETQTLVSGATVKLRLTNDVYVNGMLIPKDQFVFGEASLNGERLKIEISTIRYKNNILPVALSVYDLDGMEGVYMPGAITRDVAKQSTDQAIQSMGIASLDPSLGAQAASAGIQAAKSLIGKKAKLVKVTVKAGYQVLLRDNNQQTQ